MALSDYGVIALKNNRVYENENDDFQCLIEDGNIKIGFYKNGLFVNDKVIWIYFNRNKVMELVVDDIHFKVKHIIGNRFLAKFKLNNNFYKVYFGYGVDKHMETIYNWKKGYYGITKRELKFLKRLGFKID